ncbi:hypothetical protein [Escherichia coli]|uniref:hypothetical protein n=1 Tax=Escherichia coli TaxID=562 RepID=UPI0035954259
MKIVKAEVFVTCPGRNFVTLKITTEDGITGLGDATLNGRELSVASYLQDHLCPQLIGRDAHRIEDIWQFFYKPRFYVSTSKSIIKALINMHSFEIQLSPIG